MAICMGFYPFNADTSIKNRDISIYKYRYLYFKVNAEIYILNTDISN